MIPWAASLLKRELNFPAVVPKRSAISFDVSPFGDSCNIAMTRFWKLVIMGVRQSATQSATESRARQGRTVNLGDGSRPTGRKHLLKFGV